MISVDPSLPNAVSEQLTERLRYLIASGHYTAGEVLPSTRTMGERVGVSYHTVRRAYRHLEEAGLLETKRGVGFVVKEQPSIPLEERIERGASVAHEAVLKLIGLGLSEEEIALVLEEQLVDLGDSEERLQIVFSASFQEMAESGAAQLRRIIHHDVVPVVVSNIHEHHESDLIVAPFSDVADVRQAHPNQDVLGVLMHLDRTAPADVARLLPEQTLGLVTLHGDAIGPMLRELRHIAAFTGPAIALSADAGPDALSDLIRKVDLLVYTAAARRRLRPFLEGIPHVQASWTIEPASMNAVTEALRR